MQSDIERIVKPGPLGWDPQAIRKELTEAEEHNGWPNRETWLVHLWLSNEQGLYPEAKEKAENGSSDLDGGQGICDWLKEQPIFSDDCSPQGLWVDLITQALNRVAWEAIGAAFREE
jgi:hypothetical protein